MGSISDPISLHKYLYANANPVMNSDPSGCFIEKIVISIEFVKANAIEMAIFTGLLALLTMEIANIMNH